MEGQVKAKSVEGIMEALDPQKRKIAERLRGLVKDTLPDAVETVKWGNVTYLSNGKNLSWLIVYKDHVDLGFFLGAKLSSKLLEGSGKGLRHIKVGTLADIDDSEFGRLLKDAQKLTV
jgi:hypothetical protein